MVFVEEPRPHTQSLDRHNFAARYNNGVWEFFVHFGCGLSGRSGQTIALRSTQMYLTPYPGMIASTHNFLVGSG